LGVKPLSLIAEGRSTAKIFKGENVFKMNILVKDNIEYPAILTESFLQTDGGL
jgi:hypothetical protein